MLQQTQVKTVIPYYERFMGRFPTVVSLSEADEDEVLEYWAGLGYYSRGRNLRVAAQQVVRDHGGALPNDEAGLRSLPGIGEYTAAAIGSIAFDHAVPVIDGNVERVLARYLTLEGDPKKGDSNTLLREAARIALPNEQPGDHNQAMMELGATVCTPRAPGCGDCPIASGCRANKLGRPEAFPPPRQRRKPEIQHWLAAVIVTPTGIVVRRAAEDAPFLKTQWGVPLWPVDDAPDPRQAATKLRALVRSEFDFELGRASYQAEIKHSITYRSLRVHVVTIPASTANEQTAPRTVQVGDAWKLPGLHRKIVECAARQSTNN